MTMRSRTVALGQRVRQAFLDVLAADVRRAATGWLVASRLDLLIIVALTVLAAVPRLVMLTDIPPGLHGDEGWTGIDARRILNEGWIGPYVGSAMGQPAGPLYFAAPFVKLFGNTVFSIRLSMALLGIVTIPIAYLTFRVMFDRTTATFAAMLLALGLWHLHYSRIAFMVISWPLIELMILLFFFQGLKTGRWLYYSLSGLALGAGIYTYNVYPVFVVPFGLVLALIAFRRRGRPLLQYGGRVALMTALALFAALPMISYATDSSNAYFNHHRAQSLLETDEWEGRDLADRGKLVLDRMRDYFVSAYWEGRTDGVDGAGESAMVDRVSVALLAIGAVILLMRWRQPASVAVLLMVLLLPFASVFSITAAFRRTLGIVPFLAVLAAVPLAAWWKWSVGFSHLWRNASYAAVALVVVLIGVLNLRAYFQDFGDSQLGRFAFAEEIAVASEYIRDAPSNPYVYFYAGRWSYGYETRRYLAPAAEGEDRSREFGESHEFSLARDRGGEVMYVFLDPYLDQADEVERLYPGGTRFESTDGDGRIQFRAYSLPADDSLPEVPVPEPERQATPASAPGTAGERDRKRMQDLETIRRALQAYRQENAVYPDSGGSVQSLCVFADADAGCELAGLLSPLPADPLGDPVRDGYWYSSTGDEFIIFAQRESDEFPPCAERPPHLAQFRSLLCAQGP